MLTKSIPSSYLPCKSQLIGSLERLNFEVSKQSAQKEHMTQRSQQHNGNYSSNYKRITAKQTSTQTFRNKLRQAREEKAPPHIIKDLGKSLTKEKHELLKLQHQVRQKSVTDAMHSSLLNPNHLTTSPHSLWDLLRRYKTDHPQSDLPTQTHDNTSYDPRIWKLGPLTLDPQAWHRFRYALWTSSSQAQVLAIQRDCCPQTISALCSKCTPP